jgi:UDP-N-acetylglucosamine 2-epimerase (non-hydrolysing)
MQVKKNIEGLDRPAEIDEISKIWPKKNRRMILVTCHRRESLYGGLQNICQGIRDSAIQFTDTDFIFPMHPNPSIRKVLKDQFKDVNNVHLIEALSYPVFVYLLLNAYLVITDSGGIQEEASVLAKPVIIIREKTERVEILKSQALLVGFDIGEIIRAVDSLMNDNVLYRNLAYEERHYGDGHASELIWKHLEFFFNQKSLC